MNLWFTAFTNEPSPGYCTETSFWCTVRLWYTSIPLVGNLLSQPSALQTNGCGTSLVVSSMAFEIEGTLCVIRSYALNGSVSCAPANIHHTFTYTSELQKSISAEKKEKMLLNFSKFYFLVPNYYRGNLTCASPITQLLHNPALYNILPKALCIMPWTMERRSKNHIETSHHWTLLVKININE